MPVTPIKIGNTTENSTRSTTSRIMERGMAAAGLPMDCRKMAHAFYTHVNMSSER